MAQGIAVSFFNNPVEGNRIIYSVEINGIKIGFINGLDTVDFEFTNNDAEILANPFHRVKIGSDIHQTALNLKAFLDNNGYTSSSVPTEVNAIQGNVTWYVEQIFYANDKITNFNIDSDNTNVGITGFNTYTPPTTVALKYFMQYENIVNDLWRCEIYEKKYTGQPKEIFGSIEIVKSEVKNHIEPIRGTQVTLKLEADKNITFEDFYSKNETDFTVKVFRNNVLIFQGFVKPDGIFQSFVSDFWIVNVSCVDGLGFLADLSFVKPNGLPYSGRVSMFDILSNCLNRTGLQLKINTYVNVFYYGLPFVTPDTDVLKNAYLNTERFKKSDDNTLMSCQEVLLSILDIFNACITQDRGEWHIYRAVDFYDKDLVFFKRYEINSSFIGRVPYYLQKDLGSQSDNYYPHHCSANQRIEIKGAVSAFRLGYKYGFLGSLLGNGSLIHTAGTKIYEDWEVQTWTESLLTGSLVIDPVSTSGISFRSATTLGAPRQFREALISDVSVFLEEGYTFDFKTRFISYGFPVAVRFSVRVGDYFLNWIDGSWESTTALHFDLVNAAASDFPNNTGTLVEYKYDRTFTISSQPLPEAGDVEITMFVPQKVIGGPDVPLVEVKSIELINTFQGNNVIGEFHTVSRINPVSSIVKENKAVANGDNSNDVYLGAIYQEDKIELTKNWYREGTDPHEVKPLLRIAAEDQLRVSQMPTKLFSGNVYGYASYLTVYNINNIQGQFMPISWSYDTISNITYLKHLELYAPELYDMDYIKTDDYGETVKPTIVG